jgi:hypothetical protein
MPFRQSKLHRAEPRVRPAVSVVVEAFVMEYFAIDGGRCSTERPEKSWRSDRKQVCKCGTYLANDNFRVDLEEDVHNYPLTFLGGTSIGVIRSDVMALLDKEFDKRFFIGTLYHEDRLIQSAVAFAGRATIHLRGGPTSIFRVCKDCGHPCYCALGSRYLLRADIPSDARAFPTVSSAIIINEDVLADIVRAGVQPLSTYHLSVLDEPMDGLPADLRLVAPGFSMNQSR